MHHRQLAPMLNTFMRAKYRCGLEIMVVREEIRKKEERREESALKALVKTRTTIVGKGGEVGNDRKV